jgi:hypothetical protein
MEYELHKHNSDSFAKTLLYSEIPSYYKWEKNQWVKRSSNAKRVISRIYAVSPSESELTRQK